MIRSMPTPVPPADKPLDALAPVAPLALEPDGALRLVVTTPARIADFAPPHQR